MDITPLVNYFNEYIPLDKDEIAFLNKVFHERKIRKKYYLLQAGDICKNISFVVEGCLRLFHLDKNGKEHNLQFSIENWWIGDVSSFYRQEPANLFIESLEDSHILQISRDDLMMLFNTYPKFSHIFRIITENALVSVQNRVLHKASATAEERYLEFAEKYPQIFNRLSNVQIASYLGVTPEFLSTIRSRLAKS